MFTARSDPKVTQPPGVARQRIPGGLVRAATAAIGTCLVSRATAIHTRCAMSCILAKMSVRLCSVLRILTSPGAQIILTIALQKTIASTNTATALLSGIMQIFTLQVMIRK